MDMFSEFEWVLFILQSHVQSADPTPFSYKYLRKPIPRGEEDFSKYVVNVPHRKKEERCVCTSALKGYQRKNTERMRHREVERNSVWKTSSTVEAPEVALCVLVYF